MSNDLALCSHHIVAEVLVLNHVLRRNVRASQEVAVIGGLQLRTAKLLHQQVLESINRHLSLVLRVLVLEHLVKVHPCALDCTVNST